MARRGRFPSSLGDIAAEWIEANCTHGPGDVYGQPVRLTSEECDFLDDAYKIDGQTGRRETDIAAYVRRKGLRKSELGSWLVAFEAVGPSRADLDGTRTIVRPVVDPAIYCIATTEHQGDLVYGAFRAIVKASPSLEHLFDVGLEVTYLVDRPGKVELVQARNAAALDGIRPTFEVVDEPHLWFPSKGLDESWATLRRGLRKRHASQPWAFLPSTAYGPGQESVLEVLHAAVGKRDGRHRVGRLLIDWRQAGDQWDISDATQLRMAIEEAGGDSTWSDDEAIAAEYESGTVPEHEFRRYWLNQPVEVDTDSWLPRGRWHDSREAGCKVNVEHPFCASLDVAIRNDTAALRWGQFRPDGKVVTEEQVFHAKGDVIDQWAIVEKVLELHRSTNLTEVAYDPAYFPMGAAVLLDNGVNMVEFPQSHARMVPACGLAYEMICTAQVVHDDSPWGAAQVVAATPKSTGEGWRLSKGRDRTKHIDSAIALVMLLATLTIVSESVPEPFAIYV